jgi:hypothetical protein
VQAREAIQNLTERLATAKADVDAWKIVFSVDVVAPTAANPAFEMVVTATVGGRGKQIRIPQHEVQYFNGDFAGMARFYAHDLLNQLLQQSAEEALAPEFITACRNIMQLTSRSSL